MSSTTFPEHKKVASVFPVVRCFAGLRRTLGSVILATTAACNGTTSAQGPVEQLPRDGDTYWPSTTWRSAAPAQVGLDAERLAGLVQQIRSNAIPGLHSLVIVRHGYVAVEEYFNGSSATEVHTMQSVSKSVTSLVTGIAIGEGKLTTTSRVFDLLPAYDTLIRGDERKRAVTVGSLLQMRSGIDFYEQPYAGSPLERLNTSRGDWVAIALGEPMNAVPGERWQYNSGGVIALGKAVQVATGVRFVQYAREKLFTPLGITTQFWFVSPFDSVPHTGGGLSLRAMDLARIGYLVLRNGRWNSVPIVSPEWLRESTRTYSTNPYQLGPYGTEYGYLWWLLTVPGSSEKMITASGNMNQWLFVVPRLDVVVAVTGAANEANVPQFVIDDIIPSVIRD
jgi:CubicO group peptidase (beta-lactamase class C family)